MPESSIDAQFAVKCEPPERNIERWPFRPSLPHLGPRLFELPKAWRSSSVGQRCVVDIVRSNG